MSFESKSFDVPDDVVTLDHGQIQVVTIGSITIGREVLQPGWRWSQHVKPIVGTEWCEFHHVMYLQSGRVRVISPTGETRDVVAGEVADIGPGHDAWVVGDEPAVSIDIQGVVDWAKAPEPGDRVLTTVLFTDIVSSTDVAARLGDRAWKRLLAAHLEDVRALLGHHRGRLVNTTGDGIVATFDAPARAIRCAIALADASGRQGIDIRAGVHTGEVEFAGKDLRGVAVHLAARVMAEAAPGETYVTATTRDLTLGAGIEFVGRGVRVLKGVDGEWQVFSARLATGAPPS